MMDQLSAIIYILTAIAFFLDRWRERKAKKPDPLHFEKAYEVDSRVYPVLWNLLIRLGCDRVYMIQFHNGEHFYSGQSIQRYSISHEVTRPGVTAIRRSYINIPITFRVHELIKKLKLAGVNSVPSIADLDGEDPTIDFMGLYSIQSLYEYHIVDLHQRTLGILVLHFGRPDAMEDIHHLQVENSINEIRNILIKK